MKLKFYETFKEGKINFGDAINQMIWPQVLPEVFDEDETVAFLGLAR